MLNAGLFTPPGGSKSRLKSRLTFNDLFIFFCRDPIATTSPPCLKPPLHSQGVKMQFTHERKNMGRYHALQLLGKIPESLSPACGFFSHLLPHPSPPTPCLSSPLRGRRHLCKGELLFFHLKVFTKHRPVPPARPTHPFSTLSLSTRSLCLSFTPLHLCNLPLTALPAFSASLFFLVPSMFVCLSSSGGTAGSTELVGEMD